MNRDGGGQSDHTGTKNRNLCSPTIKNEGRCSPSKVFGPFASKKVNHPVLVMVRKYYAEAICYYYFF